MFVFEVEYLLGRVFAGEFRDRSESEWPPHPGRLFSALAAAHFENGGHKREKQALEWLENQNPPYIRVGSRGEPTRTMAYVPTNYAGDNVPALRNKQPRYFPVQAPSEATVYFIWPHATADPDIFTALDDLASRTAYLGKACSLVRMRATDSAPEHNYVPDPAGNEVLRVPSHGRLQELEWLFSADRRPSPGAQARYMNLDETHVEPEPVTTEFGEMIVFRRASGGGLPIEATLTLTSAVRGAIMSAAGESGSVSDLIHGHNQDAHCAIMGLPFVGREHADGHLMGFAVVLPHATAVTERRSILAACAKLRHLQIPGVCTWTVEGVDEIPLNQALRAATWTRPAHRWKTVTPILLDRFPKKKGPTVEDILASGCQHVGLPAPTKIEHSPYCQLPGVPPVPAFRLRRKPDERPRWGVHATLEFQVPVRGPLLLGAGRYFGLGMMRPEREQNNDDEQLQ